MDLERGEGEVKKDSPIAGETRIDDVVIIYNRCINQRLRLELYYTGYESVRGLISHFPFLCICYDLTTLTRTLESYLALEILKAS